LVVIWGYVESGHKVRDSVFRGEALLKVIKETKKKKKKMRFKRKIYCGRLLRHLIRSTLRCCLSNVISLYSAISFVLL
jgi:hypothetical protein